MIIISHRGYWLDPFERNQRSAFERSFKLGFGTETDLRDFNGTVVISHDVPKGHELTFLNFLDIYKNSSSIPLPLALNVKADGLSEMVRIALTDYSDLDVFVFDMSVPDMRNYFDVGIPVFTRMSEVEKSPAWFEHSAGVWLDGFESTWFDEDTLDRLLATGKRVCVVSSELHGRDPKELWSMLYLHRNVDNLLLCTDYPERARKFFKV